MNHNYIRPGGVAADLPDGWQERRARRCATSSSAGVARVRRRCSPRTRSGASARSASACITTEEALALGATGPILRSTGFAWDLRKAQPYLAYDEVDFDVDLHARTATCFDRYRIRLYEILESVKIVRQCVERMPRGRLPRAGPQGHAAAAGAHRRVDGSADPPLQALHRGLQGAGGRDLRRDRVAARRDRLLPRVRRHGEAGAAAHPRAVVLQPAVDGRDGARARCSPTRSRSSRASTRSWGRSTASGLHRRQPSTAPREIVARYPHQKSAIAAAAAPRAGPGRLGHARGDGGDRRPRSTSRPRSCSGRAPSTRCSSASRSGSCVVSVCTNVTLPRERRARAARAPASAATPTTTT